MTESDISGDAVNIASRIEPLAGDGGVCLSSQVYDQVHNKLEIRFEDLGPKTLKNVAEPMEVYRMIMPWEVSQAPRELDRRRVAILPFTNMSPDPQDEYFAEGLHEELISTMSKIVELSVISRTSVLMFKDKPKPAGEIGKDLKAGTILEGSVRKAGNRIRVTIQSIDATVDRHEWGESYERELQDVFAIQTDIAERVAATLRVQLVPNEKRDISKRPTESVAAHEFYLKGRFHFYKYQRRQDFEAALEFFNEAIRADPDYAMAHAGISDVYHIASHYHWFSPEEAFPVMKEHARRAIELDPRLAEAHFALGAVYFHYEWEWANAEKEFLLALELRPSYEIVYEAYSYLLAIVGRSDESVLQARRGFELSPEYLSLWLQTGYGQGSTMVALMSKEESVRQLERLVSSNPDYPLAHDCLGFAYFRASRTEDALAEMRKAGELTNRDSLSMADLALLLTLSGREQEANKILPDLQESSKKTYVSEVMIGCILYRLGRHDEAFSNLEQAFRRRAMDLPDVRIMPEMGDLRQDQRWVSIEARMGLKATGGGFAP